MVFMSGKLELILEIASNVIEWFCRRCEGKWYWIRLMLIYETWVYILVRKKCG